jgi:hypothetical protein
MQTHIQEQAVPMRCSLKFVYSYFFLWQHALQSKVPSTLFALCKLFGSPSLNRFVGLFPNIYHFSLQELLVTKRVNRWIFNPSSRKFYCLLYCDLFLFHFYYPFPQGVHILLQIFYVVLICDFFIYYTVVNQESNAPVNVPPNIIHL